MSVFKIIAVTRDFAQLGDIPWLPQHLFERERENVKPALSRSAKTFSQSEPFQANQGSALQAQ